MPPWPPKSDEKSFMFKCLLIYEKKISPRNKNNAIIAENIKLKFNKIRIIVVKRKEIVVPDHVLFGLIDGVMRGPPIFLPKRYAIVSLKKDTNIII